jgi:UDP-N-acetylmuramoylalanine--D-glutamate ligase
MTLILGGKDKDMDFTVLLPVLEEKVLNLILIGETKQKILNILNTGSKRVQYDEKTADKKMANRKIAIEKTADRKASQDNAGYKVIICDSLQEAVDKGIEITESGNVFLLSPACASFDMFTDYKDRGKKFKKSVLDKAK